MKKILIVLFSVVVSFPVVAKEANKTLIFTSILPQEYFVERIGGDRINVQTLVKPGSSPATYEPTPRQMASLSNAKLFFRIGVPFEKVLVPKIKKIKGLRIVDTTVSIKLRKMKAHHHHEEKNDQKTKNDPHVWLSPKLVKTQARNIAAALIAADPAGKTMFENNLAIFLKDLDTLDAKLSEALAPVKGKTFMVFHPAWGYFADAYGLKQEASEIEGKDPSGQQLARLIKMAKDEGVQVIFVQPQFSKRSAKRVAEAINGAVVLINPLARDYINNLEQIAVTVKKALQKQKIMKRLGA
jgi:zinc transport system substrate-binding protein